MSLIHQRRRSDTINSSRMVASPTSNQPAAIAPHWPSKPTGPEQGVAIHRSRPWLPEHLGHSSFDHGFGVTQIRLQLPMRGERKQSERPIGNRSHTPITLNLRSTSRQPSRNRRRERRNYSFLSNYHAFFKSPYHFSISCQPPKRRRAPLQSRVRHGTALLGWRQAFCSLGQPWIVLARRVQGRPTRPLVPDRTAREAWPPTGRSPPRAGNNHCARPSPDLPHGHQEPRAA